jgi:hypothetical protein
MFASTNHLISDEAFEEPPHPFLHETFNLMALHPSYIGGIWDQPTPRRQAKQIIIND